MKHEPHEIWNGITTRSPALRLVTSLPTSSTMPMGSWPRMLPSPMNGPRVSYRCRSDPQMLVDVIFTIASVDCWITGSGTVSTLTSRLPCQVTAFIELPPSVSSDGLHSTSRGKPRPSVRGAGAARCGPSGGGVDAGDGEALDVQQVAAGGGDEGQRPLPGVRQAHPRGPRLPFLTAAGRHTAERPHRAA